LQKNKKQQKNWKWRNGDERTQKKIKKKKKSRSITPEPKGRPGQVAGHEKGIKRQGEKRVGTKKFTKRGTTEKWYVFSHVAATNVEKKIREGGGVGWKGPSSLHNKREIERN